MKTTYCLLLSCALSFLLPAAPAADLDPNQAFWAMSLVGFFPGESHGMPKRLNCYLVRREGRWVAGVGTATYQGRPQYNAALMLVDPSGVTVEGKSATGKLQVTIVPDPWIPADQRGHEITVSIHATVTTSNSLTGTWESTSTEPKAVVEAAQLSVTGSGTISGDLGGVGVPDLTEASYDLALCNLIPGGTDNFQRRRAISIGIKEGKLVSARLGQMDSRHRMYDFVPIPTPTAAEIRPDDIKIPLTFEADSLDGIPTQFAITLTGRRVVDWVAGAYSG